MGVACPKVDVAVLNVHSSFSCYLCSHNIRTLYKPIHYYSHRTSVQLPYTVHAKIFIGDKFLWASFPTKIKPTKICTHEELVTAITVGYSYPQKLIPMKYCDHENLYIYGMWNILQKLLLFLLMLTLQFYEPTIDSKIENHPNNSTLYLLKIKHTRTHAHG